MRQRWVESMAGLSLLLAAAPALAAPPSAELVLKNATIHTLDPSRPKAEALAVRGRELVAVGTLADVEPFVGKQTRVIDLAARR